MNKLLKDRVKLIRCFINSFEYIMSNKTFIKSIGDEEKIKEQFTNIFSQIREDKEEHFLSLSQENLCKISYSKCIEHKYDNNKRAKTTLSRYINRNLKYNVEIIKQQLLNEFVNTVWGFIYCADEENFKTLNGFDILNKYSSLGEQSCMTGSNADLVKLYCINPDKIFMIVFKDVRALLWKTDKGITILDRIYPSGHGLETVLKMWAKLKNIVYYTDLNRNADYTVTLSCKDCSDFPYLDTFKFGKFLCRKKGEPQLILEPFSNNCDIVFDQTDGSYCSYRYDY